MPAAIMIALVLTLDLLKDRKDRTTKAYYDHETALMNDIRTAGVRNPIKVVPEGDKYRVVCGQTRVNASRRIPGVTHIPAIVLDGSMTPSRLLIEELADNNMQEGFDVTAQAEIFLELMKENNWSQTDLCANVPAAKPGSVSRALSIFERLVAELKGRLRRGELGPRLGYALSRAPQECQLPLFEETKGMCVQGAELHILDRLQGRKAKAVTVKFRTGNTKAETTSEDAEAVIGHLTAFIEAIRRAVKAGLNSPVKNAPQFLKG